MKHRDGRAQRWGSRQTRCEFQLWRRACLCNLEIISVLDGIEIVSCAVNILERF